MIVETEAYSQEEQACHGNKRRTNRNETLFGDPGRFYVYLTYGIYYCVNVVTDKSNWANGVLLRAIAVPNENEKIAAGPSLLAKRYGLDLSHNNLTSSVENGLWIAEGSTQSKMERIISTTRIGISKAKDLPWRWYMQSSRSVSRRAKGDRCPPLGKAWNPQKGGLV